MDRNGPYTCREYREEMILLGLRRQLARGDLSDTERHALKEQIRRLENSMQME